MTSNRKRVVTWACVSVTLLVSLTSNADAQNLIQGVGARASDPMIFSLGKIQPAAEPDPPLKYLFVIDPIRPRNGNAAVHYLSANSMLETARSTLEGDAARWDYEWIGEEEFPLDEVEQFLIKTKTVREAIQNGAQCAYCDFETDWANKNGLIAMLNMTLESHQKMRNLMRYLTLECRFAIRTGDYQRASESLTCLFEIAKDVQSPKLLITELIGITGVGIALGDCQKWISQPGSPNLYWALSSVSSSSVFANDGVMGEMRVLRFGMESFQNPADKNLTSAQWMELLNRDFGSLLQATGSSGPPGFNELGIALLVTRGYPIAKQRLIAEGWDAAKLEQMPAAQVFCIYEGLTLNRILDGRIRWQLLNPQELRRASGFDGVQIQGEALPGWDVDLRFEGETVTFLSPFAALMMPALSQAYSAGERVKLQFAAVRTVEAIRMHVSQTGQVPQTLDEIKIVPVPHDPRTGKPFAYVVTETSVDVIVPEVAYGGKFGMIYRFER